ncbi:hypothetical protein HMPREF0004_0695 [Achromobacter piechaudii ATCC 43553]|uniref:Uncharacterized protein n=1 Tax=Achromobacter piechaudii ATCC 43553 TaxID=742159 RepID=D4X5E8_9BURK|nr:hypothetical protein HMPREF0004_0695 [Achromobacter piechaudii ATCC 43553]
MDNYLNLEILILFISLQPFLPVQELCVGKKLKLDNISSTPKKARLFNMPPHNVHNLAT